MDGSNISQWNTAALRNALQGEQGTCVVLEISRNMAHIYDDGRGAASDAGAREGEGEACELAIMTVKLLRGSPMFWYWHDKHQVVVNEAAALASQVEFAQSRCDQLQQELSDARRSAAERERLLEQQVAHMREEVSRVNLKMKEVTEASEDERASVRDAYEAHIAKLSAELETKQAHVEQSMTRAKDELRASAVSSRQYQQQVAECEQKLMAQAHELDRVLAQRSQVRQNALLAAHSVAVRCTLAAALMLAGARKHAC